MLRNHFAGEDTPFRANFTPPLPLNEYFEIVEKHYRVSSEQVGVATLAVGGCGHTSSGQVGVATLAVGGWVWPH